MMTHTVLFRFVNPEDAAPAAELLRSMTGRVEGLMAVRAGTAAPNPDNPDAFHLVLITEHEDAAGLATYIADPAHQEVAAWLRSRVVGRAVADSLDVS